MGANYFRNKARQERRDRQRAEIEAEEHRKRENPTEEERMLTRLNSILCSGAADPDIEELARILRWHITGSEY